MNKRILAAAGFLLFLGGCAQLASNAIQDYGDLRNLARDYVGEQVRYRVLIRESCWRMVEAEARALAQGNPAGARALLAEAYPPLMTVETIVKGDLTTALGTINEARICGVAAPAAGAGPKTEPE